MVIFYFKINSICYNYYYLYLLAYVLIYHAVFYEFKTIGTRENEGTSHSVSKILSKS